MLSVPPTVAPVQNCGYTYQELIDWEKLSRVERLAKVGCPHTLACRTVLRAHIRPLLGSSKGNTPVPSRRRRCTAWVGDIRHCSARWHPRPNRPWPGSSVAELSATGREPHPHALPLTLLEGGHSTCGVVPALHP